MDDLEEGGRTSYDDMETEQLAAQQQRPFFITCPSNYKSMAPLAFICLLLVSYCNTAGFEDILSPMQFDSGDVRATSIYQNLNPKGIFTLKIYLPYPIMQCKSGSAWPAVRGRRTGASSGDA